MKFIAPLGRLLFSLIFIVAGTHHFSSQTAAYAASQGVPMANILVPISGVMAILGGLSILLGFHARYGALLIVLFLIPVTFMMHAYWKLSATDPMYGMQQVMFMKNISMLGGALLIFQLGSGPLSVDTICSSKCKKTEAS